MALTKILFSLIINLNDFLCLLANCLDINPQHFSEVAWFIINK